MLENTPFLLIADDTPDVLEMISVGAKLRGWRVVTASTPQEIVKAVEDNCDEYGDTCFDAMITDIYYKNGGQEEEDDHYPARTGVSVVRKLRRRFRNLPVIFITAWDIRMLRTEALAVGQELISKPFDVDYVLDRAKVWMDWYSPNKYKGQEKRKYGINRSGYYRRKTDTQMVVPTERPSAAMKKAVTSNEQRG